MHLKSVLNATYHFLAHYHFSFPSLAVTISCATQASLHLTEPVCHTMIVLFLFDLTSEKFSFYVTKCGLIMSDSMR